jgi:hypothetical protein
LGKDGRYGREAVLRENIICPKNAPVKFHPAKLFFAWAGPALNAVKIVHGRLNDALETGHTNERRVPARSRVHGSFNVVFKKTYSHGSPPVEGMLIVAVGLIKRLDSVNIHGIDGRVATPQRLRFLGHQFRRPQVSLPIITNEYEGVFRIQANKLLEILHFLLGKSLDIAVHHVAVPGVERPGEQGGRRVHPPFLLELAELRVGMLLGDILVQMRASRQKHQVALISVRPPFVRSRRTKIELTVEGQNARIQGMTRQPPVDTGREAPPGRCQGVVHV